MYKILRWDEVVERLKERPYTIFGFRNGTLYQGTSISIERIGESRFRISGGALLVQKKGGWVEQRRPGPVSLEVEIRERERLPQEFENGCIAFTASGANCTLFPDNREEQEPYE